MSILPFWKEFLHVTVIEKKKSVIGREHSHLTHILIWLSENEKTHAVKNHIINHSCKDHAFIFKKWKFVRMFGIVE